LADVADDETVASVTASRALLEAINYRGDVYMFWVPGAPLLETRRRIFKAILADYPAVKYHEVPVPNFSVSGAQSSMQDLLVANPTKGSIAGVFGAYDQLISGAVEAIRLKGRSEIPVVSIDGDRLTFALLYQVGSPQVATVVQDVPLIGHTAASALLTFIGTGTRPTTTTLFTSLYLATRANGIAAGKKRWGDNVFTTLKMDERAILKRYPQTQPIAPLQVLPIVI
jgi:ribose transport system substrate-binding protein